MGGFLKIKLNIQLLLQGSRGEGCVQSIPGGFSDQNLIHLRNQRKNKACHEKTEGVPH